MAKVDTLSKAENNYNCLTLVEENLSTQTGIFISQ